MKLKALMALTVSLAAVIGTSDGVAQQKIRSISQSASTKAAQQHPQIVAEFGGEESGARSAYVRNVGARVANQTNISGGGNAFRITTLNSPVMNAFAVPGGYLYITRQLLGLMNDEAELASVLGHEAGHIAARHSSERQRTGLLSQLGALLVGVVTGSGQLAQLAGAGRAIVHPALFAQPGARGRRSRRPLHRRGRLRPSRLGEHARFARHLERPRGPFPGPRAGPARDAQLGAYPPAVGRTRPARDLAGAARPAGPARASATATSICRRSTA